MAAWPGGPCPSCGNDVPPSMIRCCECRTLLNSDLEISDVKIPEYVPLPETDADPARTVTVRGFYSSCDSCGHTHRLRARYAGKRVRCKHCDAMMRTPADLSGTSQDGPKLAALYAACPDCDRPIDFAAVDVGATVFCQSCGTPVRPEHAPAAEPASV
ncbi:MAG: hypothetical protein AAF532_11785 [Planctomycetota bacterium]